MKTYKQLLPKYQRFVLLASVLVFLLVLSCVDIFNPPNEYIIKDTSEDIFSAPTGFNARQYSATTVLITWNEVADATGYKVERKTGEGGLYEKIYDGTGTSYTDTIGSPGSLEYFYRVTAYKNGESASTLPESVIFQAIIVNASKHANIPGATANANGVYPVKIGWKMPDDEDIAYFEVQRTENSGSGFATVKTIALNAISKDSEGFYNYIDNNATAKVAKKYYYRIRFLDNSNQLLLTSDEQTGWGALTHERYFLEYNKVMNTALGKLDYMHRTPDTAKLGTENPGPSGGISGNIKYQAGTVGFLGTGGAEIFIQLTNYCDFHIEDTPSKGAYFILNGNSDTKSSMLAAGNMNGTMSITGMYPGTVVYGTIWSTSANANAGITIGSGKANGGNYVVTPDGFDGEKVAWNVSGIFMATKGFNASTAINSDQRLPWLNW